MKKLFLIILLGFNSIFGQNQNEEYTNSSLVQINEVAPDFSITTSEGKIVNLSDYKGKVVLINFFATWCGPCMQEMPFIEKDIWNKLKNNKNFTILSIGRDHSQEEINAFIQKKKFTFPIYADKGKAIYNLFATKYIPRNYLIDQNGKVVYTSTGFSTGEFEELKTKINSLLNN
ncbi:TlpA disulfide reductase family protein [Flavobacterium sp.]|uniref:TlpA family protein disulfide reductase n=1 Tax=Flavobacterium sp. TaxID=239 RepID=UPI00262225A8|nr:TlpA disulfide reductase family protein [Flavobacterium sp.]